MLVLALVLLFAMCFSIYNYWFQKEKYKRLFEHEIKKLNRFNSPGAWLLYSILMFLSLLGVLCYVILKYYQAVMNLGR